MSPYENENETLVFVDGVKMTTKDIAESVMGLEEVVDEPIEDDASNAAGQDTPPVSQQMMNNNPTFFNINISGGNNIFYQHVDKLTINNGGKVVERDQARKCAEEMRDLYAAEIDESIAVLPLPWEDEHDADRDGE